MKEVIEDFVNDNIVKESRQFFAFSCFTTLDKYFCRLDGNQFGSERDVIAHIRSGHKHKIEELLKFMAEGTTFFITIQLQIWNKNI